MRLSKTIVAFAAIALTLGSCVSNKKYKQLGKAYLDTKESLVECNAETRNLQNQLEAARKQVHQTTRRRQV